LGENFTISRLMGYLLILAAITRPRICLSRPPGAFWWFALYLLFYASLAIPLEEKYRVLAIDRIFTFAQLLVLFWISHNLLQHERVLDGFLVSVVASTAVMAVVQLTGIGATEGPADEAGVVRVSVLNENPNVVGMCLVMGLLCLIGLVARRGRRGLFPLQGVLMYGLVGAVLCMLAAALLLTGSRAAVLSLVGGLTMMIMEGKSLRAKIRSCLVVFSILGIFLGLRAFSSELGSASSRLSPQTKEDLYRERIYTETWAMFLESPMQGAGPVRYAYQLADRTGHTQRSVSMLIAHGSSEEVTAHNLALAALAETGLIGFTPYFLGLISCTAAAWKYRRTHRMALPLALLFAVLVYNVTHTWDGHKLHWIVLALATVRGEPPVGSATGLRPTSRGEIPHGPRT